MRALIVMHDEMNGPGILLGLLQQLGAETWIARLYDGDLLPGEVSDYDVYFLMGGDMCANDEENYPYLEGEAQFLARAVEAGAPVLGICFGAQMIARSCGGSVYKAPVTELGFSEITLTEEGQADPLFEGLPSIVPVFQWHQDTFEPPEEARRLAKSAACPNQAYRYRNAWGVQHHPEITDKILSAWFANHPDKRAHLDRLAQLEPKVSADARRLFENFIKCAARLRSGQAGKRPGEKFSEKENIIYLFKRK